MPLRTSLPSSTGSALGSLGDRVTPGQLALGRVGAGASMVVRPKALPQLMGLDSATATRSAWAVQMLGIRDLALGVGTLVALRDQDRRSARTWLTLGLVCDAVDALALGGAALRGRVSRGGAGVGVAVALAAVAVGAKALQEDEAGH